jgi:hypothetical protein
MGNKILFEVHTNAGEQTNTQVGSQIDLGGILKCIFSNSQYPRRPKSREGRKNHMTK